MASRARTESLVALLAALATATACAANPDLSDASVPHATATHALPPPPECTAPEVRAIELPLAADAAHPDLEISGLAWFGDWLILLPENLGRGFSIFGGLAQGPQFILAVARDDIEAMLAGERLAPLEARRIPVSPAIEGRLPRFDGFEAIAFDGNTAWLAVETLPDESGYIAALILRGELASDLSGLTLDLERIATVWSQSTRPNASEEAIVLHDGELITLYELNGARITPEPVVHVFERGLDLPSVRRPSPSLEYRITDATAPDADGHFWVINYSWPGSGNHDASENVHPDPLRLRHGCGPTHGRYEQVERLVELRLTRTGVELTDTPPIQIELEGDWQAGLSRNWEGIARLDERGFLIVTDRFPRTILAFVPR